MTILKPEWMLTPHGLRTGLAIELDGDRIAALVDADRHPEVPTAVGRLALPGLVNAHSHAFQRAIRGHVQWRPSGRDDFWSWRDRMYRVALRITPAQLRDVAAQLYVELMQGGYTHVCEFHYLQHGLDGRPYDDPLEMCWSCYLEEAPPYVVDPARAARLVPVLRELLQATLDWRPDA